MKFASLARAFQQTKETPRQKPYYGSVLVVVLGLTTIISYGTTQYLFGVLVVPITQETGWNRASLSGAYSLMLIFSGLLGVPIGRWVDRHGARVAMAVGSALGGLSLLGLAAIHTLWQFYLLWAGGLGVAIALTFYPVTFTVVANWFERRRGSAMAVLTLLGGLASPIFIPLAGVLILHLDWRGTVVVMAIAQLGIALPLHALALRRHPEDLGLRPDGAVGPPQHERTGANPFMIHGLSVRAALTCAPFWTLTVAYSLAGLALSVLLVHVVPYLVGRGYSGVFAATTAGAVGLMSLPGRYGLNKLSDRAGVGPQRLLVLCLGLQGVGVLLLLGGGSFGPGWLVAYVIVYGAGFGAVSPLRASVMAEQFGRRAYGVITAIQGVPVALAAALGPLFAGWLYDGLGDYNLALGLCAGTFVLAAVAVGLTRRPPIVMIEDVPQPREGG
ncbi:MAG TPA: MFS transporter [Ktedonobacterales bacterium]|nr:MFS transporter [Ktedonobacterales bacterium]